MTEDNQEESVKVEHLVMALNRYGASDVLSLLVRFSDQDWAVKQLLIRFPSIVSISRSCLESPCLKLREFPLKNFSKQIAPLR